MLVTLEPRMTRPTQTTSDDCLSCGTVLWYTGRRWQTALRLVAMTDLGSDAFTNGVVEILVQTVVNAGGPLHAAFLGETPQQLTHTCRRPAGMDSGQQYSYFVRGTNSALR